MALADGYVNFTFLFQGAHSDLKVACNTFCYYRFRKFCILPCAWHSSESPMKQMCQTSDQILLLCGVTSSIRYFSQKVNTEFWKFFDLISAPRMTLFGFPIKRMLSITIRRSWKNEILLNFIFYFEERGVIAKYF